MESNPDAIRKTKANIKLVDQREPGVVLNDGRVIDGNRRFTCLRQLSAEDTKFGWFEAVILERSMEHSAKQIKLLELSIQHGEEGKVDYDPIDRLVGVYHDIHETGLLTPEEYARSTNESVGDVKKRMDLAELMVELLEFINAPGQFHIARDLKLYYPLEELQKLLKKCRTENEKEDLKNSVFVNILLRPAGDTEAERLPHTNTRRDAHARRADSNAHYREQRGKHCHRLPEAPGGKGRGHRRFAGDVLLSL